MSPRIVCGCGCGKTFYPKRPWQKFLNSSHRGRKWAIGHPRRKARKRAGAASNALTTHSKRITCRRRIEVGFVRKALSLVSLIPFALPGGFSEWAAGGTVGRGRSVAA